MENILTYHRYKNLKVFLNKQMQVRYLGDTAELIIFGAIPLIGFWAIMIYISPIFAIFALPVTIIWLLGKDAPYGSRF